MFSDMEVMSSDLQEISWDLFSVDGAYFLII